MRTANRPSSIVVLGLALLVAGTVAPASADTTREEASSAAAKKSSLTVEVTHLRNHEGRVAVALFNSDEAFPEQSKALHGQLAKISNKRARVTFRDLKPGIYAVAILHDENGNDEMDFNFLGMPLEGYGFSNNVSGMFGPPSFEAASLKLRTGSFKTAIKTKYFSL